MKHNSIVAGGGAIEMELSRYLRDYSRKIEGKQQLIINAFAKALEVIPRQLAFNAGFDATDILNKIRQKHYQVLAPLLFISWGDSQYLRARRTSGSESTSSTRAFATLSRVLCGSRP